MSLLLKCVGSARKSYGMAALLSLGLAATRQGAAAGCTYNTTGDWGNVATGEITVTNSGNSTLNGWSMGWQFNNNRVTSSWNANVSGANPYTASNISWNGTLQPGQSAIFGIQIDKRGSAAEIPVFSGAICGSAASSAPSSSCTRPSAAPVV